MRRRSTWAQRSAALPDSSRPAMAPNPGHSPRCRARFASSASTRTTQTLSMREHSAAFPEATRAATAALVGPSSLACRHTSRAAIYAADSNTLYASSGSGVFKSTDAGATWVAKGLDGVNNVTVDPTSSDIVYAGTSENGIQKSFDGGDDWQTKNVGFTNVEIFALVVSPTDSNTVYAGTTNGVFKSTDLGRSWVAASD